MKTILIAFAFLCIGAVPFSAKAQTEITTVYVTNTGEKYHLGSCHYLSKSKIETTMAKAKTEGYTPCKVCKPGGAVYVPSSTTSVQCSGTTQKGARCKRRTTSASGRCYQH